MKRIYMDYAATTPCDPRVVESINSLWMETFGNPSSIHRYGQEALQSIEDARNTLSRILNAQSKEIIFTSGGTEADNTVIKGVCIPLRDKGNQIITSSIEHRAVLETCEYMKSMGFQVTHLPVDQNGLVDPDDIEKAITRKTILISIMHANNEVGTIQPISEIGTIAKKHNILFHTDAVQTFGHVDIDVQKMGIDLLALSAHKCYGPKGVGALYIREGIPLVPLIHGGGHENGRRSSTHNVPGIVGLGKAAELANNEMHEENEKIQNLRDHLLSTIENQIEEMKLNGHKTERLVNNINISVKHVEGESMLMNLDLEGIAVSSGSACSAGSSRPSHVLKAMGVPIELARGSLRITLGRFTTKKEIDRTAEVLINTVNHLRSLSSS